MYSSKALYTAILKKTKSQGKTSTFFIEAKGNECVLFLHHILVHSLLQLSTNYTYVNLWCMWTAIRICSLLHVVQKVQPQDNDCNDSSRGLQKTRISNVCIISYTQVTYVNHGGGGSNKKASAASTAS